MPFSPKEQRLISTMLHRLLKAPGANQEAITNALAKPLEEFNTDDWMLVNQVLPDLTSKDIELTSFIHLVNHIPS